MVAPAHSLLFDELIDQVMTQGYAVTDEFFSPEVVSGLRQNLQQRHAQGHMHPAGIGKDSDFHRDRSIRRDLICWLDDQPDDPVERAFLERVDAFIAWLNRTCYLGLNGREFHYALYEAGSFYRRHRDQFRHDSGRRLTLITYLNEDWTEADGGQLVLYLPEGTREILPVGGRTILFRSDELEHEVRTAHRARMSMTGWLLRREGLPGL